MGARSVAAAQPAYTATTRFTHDGLTLVVKRLDSTGDRLFVLIHGIGVASRYFGPLAAALGVSGSVIAVELPGMGDAPEPRDGVDIERYGALLAAWVRASGLEDVVVVGHSMGSQVAVELALQAPDALAHLVLIGAVTDPAARSVLRQAARLAIDTTREGGDVNWIVAADYLRCGPRFMLKQAPRMVAYPILERVPELRMPTLVLRGANDPICTPAFVDALTAAIPDARAETLAGQAHVTMYTDAAVAARAITRFAGIPTPDARP